MNRLLPVLVAPLLVGCPSDDYVRLYATMDKAPSLSWDAIGELDHLGPTIVDKGVNFGVYSANAERVEVLLFDDPESDRPTQQFQMTPYGEVWNVYIEGVGPGQHYGYIAWGPNWTYQDSFYPGSLEGFRADVDEFGNRFNPNKLLIDPYTKAVHRDHDWGRGSAASGPHRQQHTYGAAAKSVVVESKYTWSEGEDAWRKARAAGELPGHRKNDLIVYEVHPKGLTANGASRQFGVEHPGTFRGIGEIAPYLQDLGITAVELLPVHEKPLDGGYWGYNNISYFANEVSYHHSWQAGGEPHEMIDEFKWMVDQLHQHDVEVIIDVVYNHTGEGGLWRTKLFFNDTDGDYLCDPGNAVNLDSQEVASLLSWRGLDNASYYELANSNQAYWTGSTGVGNQTRANHTPMRRQIVDSLVYMVEELHVDGFRFDLAGVLGEPDGQRSVWWGGGQTVGSTVLQEIADHPVMQEHDVRLISEPWTTAYDGATQFPMSTNDPDYGWYEWNGNSRDWWREFINDDPFDPYDGYWAMNSRAGVDGGAILTGSAERYAWNGRRPFHSVNFVTAHDGFTLFDVMSYWEKENGCGPLNPICCEDACSAWCDPTSGDWNNHSQNWESFPFKRQMIRNAFAGMAISHGSIMMLGGDEWMRTKYGNNNSYTTWSDNEWNHFRWGEWTSRNTNNTFRHRMHDFVRDLWAFRREHTYAFSPEEYGGGMPYEWKDPSNNPAGDGTWGARNMMMHYYDDGSIGEPELLVLINFESSPIDFVLPEGRTWARVLDTQQYFDLPGTSEEPTGYFDEDLTLDPFENMNLILDPELRPVLETNSYTAMNQSIVILEQVL